MKNYLLLCLSLLMMMACGKIQDTSVRGGSTSSSPINAGWILVTISKPAAGVVGGATTANYNGTSYIIGFGTTTQIQNYINSIPPGVSVQKQVMASFSQESGHFPNPTATFNVINITQMQ